MKLQNLVLGSLTLLILTASSCVTAPRKEPSIKFTIDGKETSMEKFNLQVWKLPPDSELRLIRTKDGKTAIIRVEEER